MSNSPNGVRKVSRARAAPVVIASLLFAFAVPGGAQGNRLQSSGAKKIEDLLARSGVLRNAQPIFVESPYSLDVRVQWNAYVAREPQIRPAEAPATPGGGFAVSRVRRIPESLVLPRAPELSKDDLLVAAVDAQQQLKGWSVVSDPLVLRQEQPGPTGKLTGQVLHHTRPVFDVALPDDPAIVELRFYSPIWLGQEFSLRFLGAARLPASGR